MAKLDLSRFAEVEELFRRRSAALKTHERELMAEVRLPGDHKPHA